MTTKRNFVTKTISLITAFSAVAVCGNAAMAIPANESMNFTANVPSSCGVSIPAQSSVIPLAYDRTGSGSITSLFKTDSTTIKCNSLTANVDIQLSAISLQDNSTHAVAVTLTGEGASTTPTVNNPLDEVGDVLTNATDVTLNTASGSEGNVVIGLTSTITNTTPDVSLINGEYSTAFNITVTPQ